MDSATKKCRKTVIMISIFNILIALADKIILSHSDAYGAPVILTIILWILIIKEVNIAYLIYTILAFLAGICGIAGIFLSFAYIYRDINPWPCVLMVLVGADYFISWALLRWIRSKHK